MIDTDRLEIIDTGDGVPLTKCEQNLYEALANVEDGVFSDFTKPRLEDALADMSELVAEVKRLREGIKKIAGDYDFIAIKSQSRTKPRPAYNVPAGDGIHTVTFHQKACLKIMELIE